MAFVFGWAFTGLMSCSGDQKKEATNERSDVEVQDDMAAVYACPMHPEVMGDESAKCSKCGMALVLVKADSLDHASHDHN